MAPTANDKRSPAPGEVEGMPGQGVRTVISLLLLMHLTSLAIVFGGLYGASELQRRLMEIFRPYTQTLALDLNQASDVSPLVILDDPSVWPIYTDHHIELDLAGQGDGETLLLPGPGGAPGSLAYRRRQTLARYLAIVAESENASNKLASIILRHYGAQANDQLRCVRHMPLNWVAAQEADADPNADSMYFPVLEVTVSHVADNGNREILRSEDRGSVAPVDPTSGGDAAPASSAAPPAAPAGTVLPPALPAGQ